MVGVFFIIFIFFFLASSLIRVHNQNLKLKADIKRVGLVARQSSDRVSVLSHEIRTPLAVIRGASDLLLEESPGPLNEKQREFMSTIGSNSTNLVELAEDLLTQARIDAGLFAMDIARVDIRALCRSVIKEQRRFLSVSIVLDDAGAPPRLWVYEKLIQQALTNLINNAVKASPDSSLITVRLRKTESGVIIAVDDNGTGMNEQARVNLFERFASGHPLRDGTGLGLVITKEIAQMHGGSLFVDSILGHGTTMIMTLPIANSEDSNA
jgi:two-component system OmpR family sensor kinase